jgi:hypothetical protein
MKRGRREFNRAKRVVILVEWAEPLEVCLSDPIGNYHAPFICHHKRLWSISGRIRHAVQQDNLVLLMRIKGAVHRRRPAPFRNRL